MESLLSTTSNPSAVDQLIAAFQAGPKKTDKDAKAKKATEAEKGEGMCARIIAVVKNIFATIVYLLTCTMIDLRTKVAVFAEQPGFHALTSLPKKEGQLEKDVLAILLNANVATGDEEPKPLKALLAEAKKKEGKEAIEAEMAQVNLEECAKELAKDLTTAFRSGLRPVEWKFEMGEGKKLSLTIYAPADVKEAQLPTFVNKKEKRVGVSATKWTKTTVKLVEEKKKAEPKKAAKSKSEKGATAADKKKPTTVKCQKATVTYSTDKLPSCQKAVKALLVKKHAELAEQIPSAEAAAYKKPTKTPADLRALHDQILELQAQIATAKREQATSQGALREAELKVAGVPAERVGAVSAKLTALERELTCKAGPEAEGEGYLTNVEKKLLATYAATLEEQNPGWTFNFDMRMKSKDVCPLLAHFGASERPLPTRLLIVPSKDGFDYQTEQLPEDLLKSMRALLRGQITADQDRSFKNIARRGDDIFQFSDTNTHFILFDFTGEGRKPKTIPYDISTRCFSEEGMQDVAQQLKDVGAKAERDELHAISDIQGYLHNAMPECVITVRAVKKEEEPKAGEHVGIAFKLKKAGTEEIYPLTDDLRRALLANIVARVERKTALAYWYNDDDVIARKIAYFKGGEIFFHLPELEADA